MNKDIIEYIKILTKRDTKTIIGKALKAQEEVGELAGKALPFEGAHGCNHRFVDKISVLEEAVDVYLCVKSIALELGFDEEDWEQMTLKKAKYWDKLQRKEESYKDCPYEIHITVNTETENIDLFKGACQTLGVKPIVLDLQNNQGDSVMQDVMTSSIHIGVNETAREEMERITAGLKEKGFEVVREKIETSPWHPAAPSLDGQKEMPKDCYFESHIAVICSDVRKDELQNIAEDKNCHLSRNVFKKLDDGKYKIMMTYRDYDTYREEFESYVKTIESVLQEHSFEYDKVITEFSVYDTKVLHDNRWIDK